MLEEILPVVLEMRNSHQTEFKSKNPLRVLLLEKKQGCFVTDGNVIIQSLMCLTGETKRTDLPKPVNRIRTNYYNFTTKIGGMFKFNSEDLLQENQHPSPYYPEFHFQDRMSKITQDSFPDYSHNLEVLIIKNWGIRIVNIANTGYYGIVLQIFSYERKKEKFIISPKMHSILFEKVISSKLDQLRLKQLRDQIGKPQRANTISLCYYLKNIKTSHINKSISSNFVMLDKNGKIVKCSNQTQNGQNQVNGMSMNNFHYLPIGNVKGVLRFIRPLANFMQNKKNTINFNMFPQSPPAKTTDFDSQIQSESSQDSSSYDRNFEKNKYDERIQKREIKADQQMAISDCSDCSSPQSQDQDPLKFIYAKQMGNILKSL